MRAQQQVSRDLFAIPGVHSVGVGFKRVDGKLTDEIAILVHVDEKLPEHELKASWRIPRLGQGAGRAATPFMAGAWSAGQLLSKRVSPEDADRFGRALDHLSDDESLADLVKEARSLLKHLPGRSLQEALDRR